MIIESHDVDRITVAPAPTGDKAAICATLLRSLPDWFGIEEAIVAYTAEVEGLPMLVARDGTRPIGFVTLKQHAAQAWELHLIAVHRERHRRGIGRCLLAAAEEMIRIRGAQYLSVKTLSATASDPNYAATRHFYAAHGFRALLELPTLWSADNPCLVMVKPLDRAHSHRRFAGGRLVIASHNAGKVREIAELLAPFGAEVVSARELGLPEPEETGETFIANAELKARAAAQAAGLPALADDSGLSVDALDGRPGIYSARWAGFTRDFGLAMERLNRELMHGGAREPEQRRAHFTCALSLCWPDGHSETFEGHVHGTIVWPPRGKMGFGYDPVFEPDGETITFGEMEPQRKHAMSHRAEAFRQLVAACFAPAGR